MNTPSPQLLCLVCQTPLSVRSAQGRKSGKPSLMVICPKDGRHFRGFITDRSYVAGVLARLEGHTPASTGRTGLDDDDTPSRRSRTNLERDSEQ